MKSRTLVVLTALALMAAGDGVAQGRGGDGGSSGGSRGGGAWHGGGGSPGGGAWAGGGSRGGAWHGGGHSTRAWRGGDGSHGRWHGGGSWRGHRWHGSSVGVYFGPYWGWGWPYYGYGWPYYDAYWYRPYPYSYAYTTDYAYGPAVYVEKGTSASTVGAPPTYWFYCSDPPGWYPYVQSCTRQWQPVLPESMPPPQQSAPAPAR